MKSPIYTELLIFGCICELFHQFIRNDAILFNSCEWHYIV